MSENGKGRNLTKYDAAVAKARGEAVEESASDMSLATLANEGVQLEQFDAATIREMLKSGQLEAGEQIIVLEEGTQLRGQLLGRGQPAQFEDPKTRDVREVGTWRMRLTSGAKVSFLSSAQLDRMVPEFLGREGITIVARGGTRKTRKAQNLTEYFVAGPPASAPPLAGYVPHPSDVNTVAARGAEDLIGAPQVRR